MLNPRNLKVLHKARALSVAVHQDLRGVSFAASPDLKRQLLDAIASVPRNIHEGAGKKTVPDIVRFLDTAIGSANETEECLRLVAELSLLPAAHCDTRIDETVEVRKMLCGLRRYLRDKNP
jgi:four helix bundle protein